jgi:predicted AAA+ superfamily ATPase
MSLKPDGYLPRIIDDQLGSLLRAFGAVEIVGCRWSGKTWTALNLANSAIRLDDTRVRDAISLDPTLALDGEFPSLIDEWQEVPQVWDAVRRTIDESGSRRGMYILTGSSVPKKDSVVHSGAGRIARLQQRPMSLYEMGESSGQISLTKLFSNQYQKSEAKTDVRKIASLICRGGWPGALSLDEDDALQIPIHYIDTLLSSTANLYGKDEYTIRRLLQSLARNIGHAVTYKALADDISQGDPVSKNQKTTAQTAESYVRALKDQFMIEDINGWDAPIKSRSRVRTKPKRAFADPSLPAALLGMSPSRLLSEAQVFGTLFEELCLRDLRIYAAATDVRTTSIMYYKDADGLEVDAIIELTDGRWGAIEIKLNEEKVPEAVKSLMRLQNKTQANPFARNPEPCFMAVITGNSKFCYTTVEGVHVFPITALKN